MKKIFASLVVVCFLVAAMPRPTHAGNWEGVAAIGAVGAIIGVAVWLTGGKEVAIVKDNNVTSDKMHGREEATARLLAGCRATNGPGVVRIKGGGVENGEIDCNRYPPEPESLEQARQYGFFSQQNENVPPPESHKRSSSLYRAGQEAAQNGVRISCTSNNDYCRGYNAERR